jgi:hypothetical protein
MLKAVLQLISLASARVRGRPVRGRAKKTTRGGSGGPATRDLKIQTVGSSLPSPVSLPPIPLARADMAHSRNALSVATARHGPTRPIGRGWVRPSSWWRGGDASKRSEWFANSIESENCRVPALDSDRGANASCREDPRGWRSSLDETLVDQWKLPH